MGDQTDDKNNNKKEENQNKNLSGSSIPSKLDEGKRDGDKDNRTEQEGEQSGTESRGKTGAELFAENLGTIIELISEYFEQTRENKIVKKEEKEYYLSYRINLVVISSLVFLAVVIISAFMTYVNALSGDAFTFVLGTLFGSILTFLQKMVSNPTENQ